MEETTESGNAQCILTIFMKFEHLLTVLKIYPWHQKIWNKLCGFVSEVRASYRKLVQAKRSCTHEQCVKLNRSRFMLQTFLDSFNMESFGMRLEGKKGAGDYQERQCIVNALKKFGISSVDLYLRPEQATKNWR